VKLIDQVGGACLIFMNRSWTISIPRPEHSLISYGYYRAAVLAGALHAEDRRPDRSNVEEQNRPIVVVEYEFGTRFSE
jgi:hypothetical protein